MELYRDLYGCTASLRVSKTGGARLVIRDPYGKVIKAGNYTSRNGARIAMGRWSDCWERR